MLFKPPVMKSAGPGPTVQLRLLPQGDNPGSRDREYRVCAPRRPAGSRRSGRPALLMVLHGCRQDAEEILAGSRFAELAEANDAVVVFPSVTSWRATPPRADNCWGFWIPAERRRDEGEIGDLRRIMTAVEDEFGADPDRRYVAGLSSGGAMAVAMSVVYADAIRAAGSVAGLAFGETSAAVTAGGPRPGVCPWFLNEALLERSPRLRPLNALTRDMAKAQERAGSDRTVPLMVVNSTRDRVVRIENARMLRDVWIARHGGDPEAPERLRPRDWPVAHHRFAGEDGRTVVETVFYEGRSEEPTHYWPGDRDHPPYAHSDGPPATELLLDFFRRHGM